ncbi:hypothetical protein BpHYR1_028248 [Brachionus plicatilis]|uniref:Uncharacterized protein n=1 Tax=Brachionus plicatilis TaxID=10195 RepID=A0A3M7R753_BRAPC|nr:hypothetical protein BpHYR1_028248 [Brachionus plicatilis]
MPEYTIDPFELAKLEPLLQKRWRPNWGVKDHFLRRTSDQRWVAYSLSNQQYGKTIAQAELDANGPQRMKDSYNTEYKIAYGVDILLREKGKGNTSLYDHAANVMKGV